MGFFRSLQDSALTDWFLGSESIWTYPTVLTLHTIGMAILVGAMGDRNQAGKRCCHIWLMRFASTSID